MYKRQVLGAGVADGTFFDSALAGADNNAKTTDAGKKLRITITSAADNTANRGSDYATTYGSANTVAGDVTLLETEAAVIVGNNLDIPTKTDDAAHGYDLKAGDVVRIELIPIQDDGEAMLAADRFIGANQASATTCLLYTSPSPRDAHESRMPSSA